MDIKKLLIGIGIAAAVAGCSSQVAGVPAPVDEPDAAAVAEAPAQETALTEAEIQEMLANLQQVEPMAEVELDETAMADFLNADLATLDSGLQFAITDQGDGPVPATGEIVQLDYVGKLADGTVFDSSYEVGQPIAFPLGQGMVIPGWEEAVGQMAVGSTAKVVIPAAGAYGENGIPGVIPPNADLYFEMELLDILPGSPAAPANVAQSEFITTDSGLQYADLAEGNGSAPEDGQLVSIHYTGWLDDGTKFDSSLDRGTPFMFPLGQEYVIPGLDEGLSDMKVGGKRQLVIPAELAYGAEGAGEVIPAGATLVFEIELLDIQS